MEVADAASVARLVRGVLFLSRFPERAVVVFEQIICMLWRRWRGQAGAGLGSLRAPAVRNVVSGGGVLRVAPVTVTISTHCTVFECSVWRVRARK